MPKISDGLESHSFSPNNKDDGPGHQEVESAQTSFNSSSPLNNEGA